MIAASTKPFKICNMLQDLDEELFAFFSVYPILLLETITLDLAWATNCTLMQTTVYLSKGKPLSKQQANPVTTSMIDLMKNEVYYQEMALLLLSYWKYPGFAIIVKKFATSFTTG